MTTWPGQVLQGNLRAYQSLRVEAERYGLNLETISHNQARANTELARAETRLHALTQAQASQNRRKELRGQMMEAIVPALAVAAPVRAAVQFESAMADAAKTIDGMRDASGNLTPKYYEMETAIKRMGRELPLTHEQLAGLFAAGGQQGMTGVDELREFTTMAAHMSVAFGMSTEEAADAIGGYRTAMHLSMPETRSMLDLMNQFANTTSATEKGIADVVRRIGPLGNVGGVAAKPMTALAATLDAMKVSPEIAATGIKNLILSLTSGEAATKGQKEAFAKLGIDTVKLAQQMQKDGPAAIISVLEAVKQLPKAQQLSIMQEIFGKESIAAISPLLDSLDLVKRNLVIASDETLYAGAMQKEFENRSRTTATPDHCRKQDTGTRRNHRFRPPSRSQRYSGRGGAGHHRHGGLGRAAPNPDHRHRGCRGRLHGPARRRAGRSLCVPYLGRSLQHRSGRTGVVRSQLGREHVRL